MILVKKNTNGSVAIESEGGVVKSARICLNAVFSSPYRVTKAEDFIKSKIIDEANAEAAAEVGVSDGFVIIIQFNLLEDFYSS